MLFSMTGYGKATGSVADKTISIEIKTLNSKSVDLYTKIPNQYRELDPVMRQVISEELKRGKIDFLLTIESTGTSAAVQINKELAKAYFEDLKAANEAIGQKDVDYLSLILKMPEIFVTAKDELTDEIKSELISLVKKACGSVNDFRRQEGLALEKDFNANIEGIRLLLNDVEQYETERVEGIRQKMTKALEEIGSYDEARFQQEMIYYMEKLDVSEEKMRLSNHLDYFLSTIKEKEPGKKLGFIAQEIGREINTLGSKCNHAEIQKLVVNMKDALEKIKEQVLNTL
ncbi:MAG: YicC family protein [Flavobacteriia bacterium]|nr:YicC family protein [Flavobacteriia bacterium]OJX35309.1 MAG: YicC family protein [Flavobacteriia bacterium 40-80]